MVGVVEELLRLATFTTEFDIKAIIADRATALKWCVNMCRKIYVAPRMSSPWEAESSDMINNPGQTFKRFPTYWGWVRNSLTKCSPSRAGGSTLVANWLTCRPGEASEDGQRWWYGLHGDPKLFATFTALVDMEGDWMRNVWDAQFRLHKTALFLILSNRCLHKDIFSR